MQISKLSLYRTVVICALFLIEPAICFAADKLPAPFVVIPQPQNVILLKGSGLEPGKLRQVILNGEFLRPVMGEILSQLTIGKSSGNGTLSLILDKTNLSLPSDEGYILTISDGMADITAKTETGLFYGCQSLEQLLEDARDYNKPVPACKITDYPVLSYRAVHFDVKHHLDHMNYYYESINRLARYKINAVVFEFEDKLRYRRQPLVGAPQAISIDEMAALTRYARERHIEITPLVQGLGHATFILKHQEYANLRELPWNRWAFCPLNEGTYQVLFDLYRDAIDATPGSKYLHIGGDEIGNIGLCPRCKPTADKDGMMALNLYWLKRVCEFAKENNRIPIFWDDMPLQHSGVYETTYKDEVTESESAKAWAAGIPKLDSLLSDFPKNCVYMRWNYGMARQPGNISALDWYKSHGLNAMIATATNSEGGMLFQEDERDKGKNSSGIAVIRSFIQLAAEKNIGGALCTAWDDKSPHMENYWHGFIAAGEYSWSPTGRTLEEYDSAWFQKEFGISMPDYVSFTNQLRKGSVLWYEAYYKKGDRLDDESALQGLSQVEHWLKPLEGREKIPFDYTSKLIELPDLKSSGSWSLKYKDRLDRSVTELSNYRALSDRFTELYNSSKRNRYFWSLSAALYKLQITAPRILLALKQSDSSDKIQQKAGIENLKKAMNEFNQTWAEVKTVYGETRFISYPANYVPDRYFHTASQREDLSWMIQAEEMYFGMIEKWLQSQP
ncbi:MAG: family 20 glycosylhydrolase [Bacteroidota bacterium]|nr:family 20 glycosylhydrolase [Bacteroidota bacterium]